MKKSILLITALASFNATANQSLRDDAILVEDIEYKLAAGFYADDVVYKLPKATSAMDDNDIFKARGGGGVFRQGYMGVEGRGRESDFAYDTSSGAGDIHHIGGDFFIDYLLEMPDGDEFTFVRTWGSDTNAVENLNFFVFERCLPSFGAGPITSTTLDSGSLDTSAGEFTFLLTIPADTFIDNASCVYSVRARFDTNDSSVRLFKVRAQSLAPTP